jgi:hypothetical protein
MTQNLAKAVLKEIDPDSNPINPDKDCQVQFNPETLKVSFANQISKPESSGDKSGKPAKQFVGPGSTKLSLQLWFDVTAPMPPEQEPEQDVRKLTQKVAYFITPKPGTGEQRIPPLVRFLWGSFQFDGIMEGLEESLEFFSSDGRPLRASVTIGVTQQDISEFKFGDASGPAAMPSPGTRPLTQAPAGSSVQGLADSQGKGNNWQDIATANNIENPRLLQPGQLLDMNASSGVSSGSAPPVVSFSAGGSSQTGVSLQAGPGLQPGNTVR